MSSRTTSRATPSAISLPGSGDGHTRCDSPVSLTTTLFGRALAPASLSAAQARVLGMTMSGTYGGRGSSSFLSAVLQRSLASKLQARTASSGGSILYRLTWKGRGISPRQQICALRASGHRTSDKDSTLLAGWPTCLVRDGDKLDATPPAIEKRIRDKREIGLAMVARMTSLAGWPTATARDHKDGAECPNVPINALLGRAVWLAGWPTPTVGNATGGQSMANMSSTGRRADGSKGTVSLPGVTQLAGWGTPMTQGAAGNSDYTRKTEAACGRDIKGHGLQLTSMAQPARFTVSGEILIGSTAGMTSGGQLSPSHSRWLMGFPKEWDSCGATAMQSFRKSRKRSSKR